MSADTQISTILSSLRTLQTQLADDEMARSEIQGRLFAVEQMVAGGDLAVGRGGLVSPSLGLDAVRVLTEDPAFAAAQLAAERRVKGSQFSARATLDCSIRAALINTPWEGSSSDGSYMPSDPQRGALATEALRPLRLLEVLRSRPVASDSVEHVQMGTTGGASEQVQEGDEKPEIIFEGELKRSDIATIAGWMSASKQVLSDHGALRQVVDLVMRHKVLSRLEHQIINGPGGQGRIEGLLEQSVFLMPTIGATPADRIGEALVRLANNGYTPGLVLLNPLDWFRLTIKKTEQDKEYLFGSPTMPVPPALWNTPVVVTSSMPQGTALAADTAFITVLDREQATMTVTDSHADFFVRNLLAVLCELRAGLEVVDIAACYTFDLEFSSDD